jgi:hypothetical protein
MKKIYKSTGKVYQRGYEKPLFSTSTNMSKNSFFEENGYLFVPKMVLNPTQITCPIPLERGQFNYHQNRMDMIEYFEQDGQVDNCTSRYNIPIYRDLHFQVKKEIQEILGMDLYPTYFFDRFYFVGQQLPRHSDRESCEISVSLQISSNNPDNPWPIWFELPDGSKKYVLMNDGDAVIYKGCEREHWRDPLPSRYNKAQRIWKKIKKLPDDTYHHQIFFHFVNANGPLVQWAFDALR